MAKQSSRAAREVPGHQELMAWVGSLEPRLEAVETACREQRWTRLMRPEAPGPQEGEAERAALLLDEETWLTVMSRVSLVSPADPMQRRLVLLGRRLLVAQVESRADVYQLSQQLEADFLSSPPLVGDSQLTWGQWLGSLHTEPDCDRREQIWRGLLPAADARREPFLELVRRRNRWARKQGYANYVDLMLAPQGLSRDSVLERYVELEEATLPSYRAFATRMRHLLQRDHLSPWDIPYLLQVRLSVGGENPHTDTIGEILALIAAVGLPWEHLPVSTQITDHLPLFGLCHPVHIPDDIRLILPSQQGWEAYFETARAHGQALLAGLTQQDSFLLRESAPCYQAGMGAFLARLAAEPVWLRRRRLLPDNRLARMPQITLDLLGLRLRRLMALSVFEYQVYETPEADLDAAWGKTQEAFLSLPGEPRTDWPVEPDFILRPIHLQDEIIGELIASQAISYLYQRFGALFDNPELLEFVLPAYYADGSADEWVDNVRTATGKFLSNKALFGELVGEE